MVAQSLKWTVRDLAAMPDDGGWKRYEIIDGEMLVTRAPHIRHQGAGGNLHFALESWSRKTKLGKPFQTPGVIFSPNDAVIPDVVWVSSHKLENGLDSAGHLIVPPEIMVEVLSPGELNQQRDTELKLKLYSRYGVQEYWIVSWQLKTVEVYRFLSGELQIADTLKTDNALTSPQLPEFSLPVSEIFQ